MHWTELVTDKIIMGAIHVHVGSARDNVGSLTHSE